MSGEDAKRYILNIPGHATEKHRLSELRLFLTQLQEPQRRLKLIHVAGTNGKGSVCAFLTSLLLEAGQTVSTFTSPHLVGLRERFLVNGRMVCEEIFCSSFATVLEAVQVLERRGISHPTFFEFVFLVFLVICRDSGTEYAILETGMGGRTDATNVIENPLVTVITSISRDHMEYLGDTVEKIAAEKAGIIKAGAAVVYDKGQESTARVIEKRAKELNCAIYAVDDSWYNVEDMRDGVLSIRGKTERFGRLLLAVPFAAEYQARNCMLAIKALELVCPGESLSPSVLREGIAKTRWPGRMEQVMDGVFLDGAHNEGGIAAFVESANKIGRQRGGKVLLLMAVVSDKDYRSMLETVGRDLDFDRLFLTQVASKRALEADILLRTARPLTDKPTEVFCSVREAMKSALARKRREDTLFCAGSLYLIGEVKEMLKEIII